MKEDIKIKLLEINYIQSIYQSAEQVKQMAGNTLKSKPMDIPAMKAQRQANETMNELTQIVRILQEDVLKYFKDKYKVKLVLYTPDPKSN